ncbi:lariat debranching enzyme A-like [Ornithodoros turicata]|uniref:lariat debranching enzyme A-like n=1 Tax=Ornithodoros turicata TaxID=34597 RepID=UPI0031399978
MKIAVEGCAHGELDKIYDTIRRLEEQHSFKVDLLIICGDFQAVRNASDMECMAVPRKYQEMKDFHRYYSGEMKAPVLTIVIGGNHEASNYLAELPYGGWLCDNIYYMGYAGVVNVKGIRIAGLSGIYKGHDYLKGRFEAPPYNESAKRSAYHIRNIDIFRLKQLKEPVDIMLSHDWPRGIYNYGNKERLLRQKQFFRQEVEENRLGCRPSEELLHQLKPKYWFAAHLHCKFAALVKHEDKSCTKFLALDKCLPNRDFLQTLDMDSSDEKLELKYDLEWLSILRSTNHLVATDQKSHYMPGPGCGQRWEFAPTEEEKKEVSDLLSGNLAIPLNFAPTAPTFVPGSRPSPPQAYLNPQTSMICKTLSLCDPLEELLFPASKPSPSLSISGFFDREQDVTTASEPTLDPDNSAFEHVGDLDSPEDQDQSGSLLAAEQSCDEEPLPKILHEVSGEDRRKMHLDEFGETDAATVNLESFPEAQEEKAVPLPRTSPSGRTLKRRNQSIYMSDDS